MFRYLPGVLLVLLEISVIQVESQSRTWRIRSDKRGNVECNEFALDRCAELVPEMDKLLRTGRVPTPSTPRPTTPRPTRSPVDICSEKCLGEKKEEKKCTQCLEREEEKQKQAANRPTPRAPTPPSVTDTETVRQCRTLFLNCGERDPLAERTIVQPIRRTIEIIEPAQPVDGLNAGQGGVAPQGVVERPNVYPYPQYPYFPQQPYLPQQPYPRRPPPPPRPYQGNFIGEWNQGVRRPNGGTRNRGNGEQPPRPQPQRPQPRRPQPNDGETDRNWPDRNGNQGFVNGNVNLPPFRIGTLSLPYTYPSYPAGQGMRPQPRGRYNYYFYGNGGNVNVNEEDVFYPETSDQDD